MNIGWDEAGATRLSLIQVEHDREITSVKSASTVPYRFNCGGYRPLQELGTSGHFSLLFSKPCRIHCHTGRAFSYSMPLLVLKQMVFVDMRPILNQGNLYEVLQFFVMNQYALSTSFFTIQEARPASYLPIKSLQVTINIDVGQPDVQ